MAGLPLVSIRRYYRELDDSAILTFEAFTAEEQAKLKAILERVKNDFALERAYKRGENVIIKPDGAKLCHKYGKVYLYFKDFTFCLDLSDELLDLLADNELAGCYVELSLEGKKAISKTKAIYFGSISAIYQAD